MDSAKAQLADKLKSANNILVTVSRNPSVDQLASCIALTLILNKQGKHAAAVFSGAVPSTLEFLQPEETLEKNTDSLRDFIVSLDKSKADKLRYKVEDDVVRIFITPYRTSISEADLTFTQGDFNVEIVVALGVHLQEDLDEAITAHGRILHDATVSTINTAPGGELGTINWTDPQASSLSELVTDLAKILGGGKDLIDGQIATALLTGIVAETGRFSNEKTSSQTMNASAVLMAAGANQQLVANKLSEGQAIPESGAPIQNADPTVEHPDDHGLLEINHGAAEGAEKNAAEAPAPLPELELPKPEERREEPPVPSSPPSLPAPPSESSEPHSNITPGPRMMTEPPSLGGFLPPNNARESFDPLSVPNEEPPSFLDHQTDQAASVSAGPTTPPPWQPPSQPAQPLSPAVPPSSPTPPPPEPSAPAAFSPPPPAWQPPAITPQPASPPAVPSQPVTDDVANHTLTELEQSLQSPHVAPSHLDAARDEVSRALNDGSNPLDNTNEPLQALGAQPLGGELHDNIAPEPTVVSPTEPGPHLHEILGQPVEPPPDSQPPLSPTGPPQPPPQVINPVAPAPPVPPPIPFQFGNPAPPQP